MRRVKKRNRRGAVTLKILQIVEHTAYGIEDLVSIFTLPYGTSLGKALDEYDKRSASRGSWAEEVYDKIEMRRRMQNTISRLKADGLVEGSGKDGFQITKSGKSALKKLKAKLLSKSIQSDYPVESSNRLYVVIFDVPERDKWKREWLRSVLKQMGFEMLQKSVWISNIKLPKEFLEDLKTMELFGHLHIFAVNKPGSISSFLEDQQ